MFTEVRGPHRTLLAAGIIAVAMLAAFFIPVSGADAAKLTACVKKKNGTMKLVTGKKAKKKCPKGWKKVTWNTSGPEGPVGPVGPAGPQLSVKDANGALVGKFLSVYPAGASIYIVERDGGQFIYFGSGNLYPNTSPNYTTADCSGTAYLPSSGGIPATEQFLKVIGGPFRVVFRTQAAAVFGPATAWKSAGTYQSVVTVQLYERNSSTGVCQVDGGAFSGELIALATVATPPDFVGPLVIE